MSLKDLATYFHFILNQDAIADQYCINKDNLELLCSGKCYLNEVLVEQHSSEDQLPIQEEKKINVYYHVIDELVSITTPLIIRKTMNTHYQNEYLHLYNNRIFHPPQC